LCKNIACFYFKIAGDIVRVNILLNKIAPLVNGIGKQLRAFFAKGAFGLGIGGIGEGVNMRAGTA